MWLAAHIADGKHRDRDGTLADVRAAHPGLGIRGSKAVWGEFVKRNPPALSRRGAKLNGTQIIAGMSAASPVEAALMYAECWGWPVFPCQWEGVGRKRPLIAEGFREASADRAQIEQ